MTLIYEILEQSDLKDKEIYIFGAGSYGMQANSELQALNIQVKGFIDNAIEKQGTKVQNKLVYSVEEVMKEQPSFSKKVIIVCSMYHKEIGKQLEDLKLKENQQFFIKYFYENDASINWLNFANAGMLHPGNIELFDYAIRHLPSENPIIEIGSFCGLSTNLMNYFLGKYDKNNNIFTSDKWLFENSSGNYYLSITAKEYREFVFESFKRNIKFFSANRLPHSIEELSDDFFELWDKDNVVTDVFSRQALMGGPIAFSYIDGNHTYEYAKRDFLNVDKYLEVNGYVLFDDSSDRNEFGLTPLMQEIMENEKYTLISKNPNYLFKKIK
ncbi:class I SAM-dependent methyltransferase [Lysinibacillus sp. NPDC047702]|uniref:class I SAM-dependent methyltransferase n=1 Tax=unclassified Lysinibacillus TaxID=2636778 RepID=UPI003CFDBF41